MTAVIKTFGMSKTFFWLYMISSFILVGSFVGVYNFVKAWWINYFLVASFAPWLACMVYLLYDILRTERASRKS